MESASGEAELTASPDAVRIECRRSVSSRVRRINSVPDVPGVVLQALLTLEHVLDGKKGLLHGIHLCDVSDVWRKDLSRGKPTIRQGHAGKMEVSVCSVREE